MSEISSSSHCITNKEKYINDTSDDAEDFEDTIQLNNKKIRKEGKKYDQYCSFRTLESAMNHLKGKYCRDTCNQITLLEISTDEHNHVNVNGIINKNKGVPEANQEFKS